MYVMEHISYLVTTIALLIAYPLDFKIIFLIITSKTIHYLKSNVLTLYTIQGSIQWEGGRLPCTLNSPVSTTRIPTVVQITTEKVLLERQI